VVAGFREGLPVREVVADAPSGPRSPSCLCTLPCRFPLAVAPAVVRRDGRVQARGHPADHARLGVIGQQLDAMTGQPGVIGQVAARVIPRGKVKGTARRSMTMAAALRAALLMALMPEAGYGEILAALFGDLALVPWHVPSTVPTDTVLAGGGRPGAGPAAARHGAGPSGGDKAEADQALLDRALSEYAWVFTKRRLFVMDRNFPGVTRIRRLVQVTHVLIRIKSDITVTKTGDFLPDGSYMADVGSRDQKIRMRVIEYCADVEGQDVPEMFCLLTDLDDWRANPVAVLAAAYKWRWDGSETALRGAKSAIRGAGPSTGPIFRSRTPDMIRHEHAAWITATELVRDQSRNRTSTWHCSMQPSAPETPSPPLAPPPSRRPLPTPCRPATPPSTSPCKAAKSGSATTPGRPSRRPSATSTHRRPPQHCRLRPYGADRISRGVVTGQSRSARAQIRWPREPQLRNFAAAASQQR